MSDYSQDAYPASRSEAVVAGTPSEEKTTAEWRERIGQAKEARRQYEPAWMSNLAYASGKQWLKWNTVARRLELPSELRDRELYTTDFITEYRMTALGEMTSGDDRPELLLVQDEKWTEKYQAQANRAIRFAWEHEWEADAALHEARRLAIDVTTSAVRVRFDPNAGAVKADAPFRGEDPILDPTEARSYVAEQQGKGESANIRSIREGKTKWEPLSAFNLLVPPGIPHERDFPWEIVVRPVPLDTVKATYPRASKDLDEDGNIGSLFGYEDGAAGLDDQRLDTTERVRGHVWVYTCYERPCSSYPKGRVCVLVGNEMRLVYTREELPCVGPDGEHRSGISYFHWWRVSGRFWSRSLVEALKDPQRLLNRRKTQNSEIIDRGMPMMLVQEGSLKQTPRGLPMEKVEVRPDKPLPTLTSGIGPGQWMYQEMEWLRNDLDHASGIKRVTLGENPSYVTTYSQLALLNENDQGKREPIYLDHQRAIRRLVECGVDYMRRYWGPDKNLLLANEAEERVEAEIFNATKLPPFFILRLAEGQAKPRSQAAELKKVEDIAMYAAKAGQPLPVTWYAGSLEAGQVLELPEAPSNEQVMKASLENHMLVTGQTPSVAYYDPIEVHVPIHRSAQIQAELAGDMQLWQAIEQHILEHQAVTAQATQSIAEIAPPELGMQPGGPPQGGGPGGPPGGGPPQGGPAPEPEPSPMIPGFSPS